MQPVWNLFNKNPSLGRRAVPEDKSSERPAGDLSGPAMSVLQTRMDKCTTEQFWTVTTFATFNLAIIAEPIKKSLTNTFPNWLVVLTTVLFGLFSIMYLIDRHLEYIRMWHSMARFLEGKVVPDAFSFRAQYAARRPGLSGVTLYSGYIILIAAVSQSVYHTPHLYVAGLVLVLCFAAVIYRSWAERENKPDEKKVYLNRRQIRDISDS